LRPGRTFQLSARRRLVERGIEVVARRARRETEGMLRIGLLDDIPVIRKWWYEMSNAPVPSARGRDLRPVRLEFELPVGIGKPADIVRRLEVRLGIDPALCLQIFERAPARVLQRPIDDLARGHVEAAVLCADALCERT